MLIAVTAAGSSSACAAPRVAYEQNVTARQERLDRLNRRHRWLGAGKLATFAALLGTGVWVLNAGAKAALWVVPPLAALIACSLLHENVLRARERVARAVAHYQRGLARLADRWMGRGDAGERFIPESHPYARDLDLFGSGSVFEFLCTARTAPGQRTLAEWLLQPATPSEIALRHAAIRELRLRLDLREDLAVLGPAPEASPPSEALAAWSAGAAWAVAAWKRNLAGTLAALWLVSLAAWLSGLAAPAGLTAFLVISTVNLCVWQAARRPAEEAMAAMAPATGEAAGMAAVFERLEQEGPAAAKLAALRAALALAGRPASRRLFSLDRLARYLDARHSMFLHLLDPFALWSLNFTLAIEKWRQRWGTPLPAALAALGEYEALIALAGYGFEHPEDTLPELTTESPWFEAQGLSHPLLPVAQAVGNDLRLGPALRLAIVSGPNMAGKSTLLRAVGVNAVLALCGAPVRARRLRLSPLRVGASVCVLDSLQGGISRFYAEIRRLKQIADLARGPWPVLFLLDELMQGTNAQDRRQGAEALVRDLVAQGALGLVTTHDLALTEIAAELGEQAANFHFEDRLQDGQLRFDYRLTPGIARAGNAVALMRSLGLNV